MNEINQFSRTEIVLGTENINKLRKAKVAVFGIGGVGGYVVEALVRAGVGAFMLFDNDTVSLTNINRQIIAVHSTIGRPKVEVMKERMKDINPDVKVEIYQTFYLPENAEQYDLKGCDYIVDAIDTVSAKIELVLRAKELHIPIISSMGTGNKINPTMLEVSDIYKTSVCPLAKVMRKELKKRNVDKLKVVYSREEVIKPQIESAEITKKRSVPGSTSFVPSVAGLIIASEVVKDIIR